MSGAWRCIVFCGSVLLLAATFVIGVEIKGARRWISVPGLSSVQPSEFVKPSLAVISAWLLAQSRTERRRAGLYPLDPAGRRRAGAAGACSPTSA